MRSIVGGWDVIVVGAGPAGCAAAAAALRERPAARVLLLDRSEFPRDKPCGDGIAAGVLDRLAALGVAPEPLLAGAEPIRRLALVTSGGVEVEGNLRRPVYTIPRAEFDDRLMRAVVARGAVLRRHTVRRLDVRAGAVVVDDAFSAAAVVGADGAESAVRRGLGVPANPPRALAVAVRGYGPTGRPGAGTQVLAMSGRHWPAYAWDFPIDGARANMGYGELVAGAGSRVDLLRAMRQLLPSAAPEDRSVKGHRLPLSTWRPPIAAGRVLLAGDAQSLINPLTGEGIYTAVVSGALAGRAALAGPRAGTVYRRAMRRDLGRHLRDATVAARLGRWPALLERALLAAAGRPALFDDLVEFGLHEGGLTPRMLRAALLGR